MRIFLVGFMGCGKSTIGKQLAAKIGYQFIDQDSLIEDRFKMSISDVFAIHGEPIFRHAERDVLLSLETSDNLVVATGGGAPCFFDNIQQMNRLGLSIYLKADAKTLVKRLIDAKNTRPLIKDKSEQELLEYISEKLKEREPFYHQSTLNISAINMNASDIAKTIDNYRHQ
jgi:shikimate kinase